MAKFKTVILASEKRQDKKSNVKIRVTHNRYVRFVATEYHVLEKYFDHDSGTILPGGGFTADQADRANGKIQMLIGDMVRKTEALRNLRFMDMPSLMTILRDKHREQDLYALVDERISRHDGEGNFNYAKCFRSTKAVLKAYTSARVVPFTTIDAEWLKRYERWMRTHGIRKETKGMSANSIGVHMRNIRTVYREAMDIGLTDRAAYPFHRYRIPREDTRKRNLTAEEMQKIIHVKLSNPTMAWSRDMFLLSFYLIGINMRDLMFLTSENIDEGRVYYRRSKGKQDYSIKIFPVAQAIIDRYPGRKFILDTMERYTDYRTATRLINKKLKAIATDLKITKPVTIYWARHTWATVAIGKEVGASRDVIRYALGHGIGSLVTDIYIQFDLSQVDAVNRKVIKLVQMQPKQPRAGSVPSRETKQ